MCIIPKPKITQAPLPCPIRCPNQTTNVIVNFVFVEPDPSSAADHGRQDKAQSGLMCRRRWQRAAAAHGAAPSWDSSRRRAESAAKAGCHRRPGPCGDEEALRNCGPRGRAVTSRDIGTGIRVACDGAGRWARTAPTLHREVTGVPGISGGGWYCWSDTADDRRWQVADAADRWLIARQLVVTEADGDWRSAMTEPACEVMRNEWC